MAAAANPAEFPSEDQIWAWLEEVPDPEIPVISLVDLGIIRGVTSGPQGVTVTVTPTYSGCPATTVINLEIEAALRGHGVSEVTLERQLSPAWTSAWISETGREKLKAYGIAPPGRSENDPVSCPQCGSKDTERVSFFGSTPCKAAFRCKACLEPFDHFKCI